MSTRTTCVPAPGSFCWYEVNVPDPAKAAAFYGAMFGWTTQEVPIGDFLYETDRQGKRKKQKSKLVEVPGY